MEDVCHPRSGRDISADGQVVGILTASLFQVQLLTVDLDVDHYPTVATMVGLQNPAIVQ